MQFKILPLENMDTWDRNISDAGTIERLAEANPFGVAEGPDKKRELDDCCIQSDADGTWKQWKCFREVKSNGSKSCRGGRVLVCLACAGKAQHN